MKKSLIVISVIFFISVIGVFIILKYNIFHSQKKYSGIAYKIDQKTGKTWIIQNKKLIDMREQVSFSKDEVSGKKAIDLVKKSKAFTYYKGAIKIIKFAFRPLRISDHFVGWHAIKLDEKKYIVAYSYSNHSGRYYAFFIANIQGEYVENIKYTKVSDNMLFEIATSW